jgi:hypothetical protein
VLLFLVATEGFCEVKELRGLFIVTGPFPSENTIIVGMIRIIRKIKRKKIDKYF